MSALQKDIYVVTVTRGRRTRFSYGERLKDALAVARPRIGEKFRYARFSRKEVTEAEFRGGTYITG
jgi:hypothetical protein